MGFDLKVQDSLAENSREEEEEEEELTEDSDRDSE
jgi:hypothetical protein